MRSLAPPAVLCAVFLACTSAGTDGPGAAPPEAGAEPGSEASVELDGAAGPDAAPADAADASDAAKDALDAADAAPVYSGAHMWSKVFDAANYKMIGGPGGSVFLHGVLDGVGDFGGGPLAAPGYYLARLDKNGQHMWSKRVDAIGHLAADATGFYLAGAFKGTIDLGGGPLTPVGFQDTFLAKFDLAGNHLWSRRFGEAAARSTEARGVVAVGADVVIMGRCATDCSALDFGGGAMTGVGPKSFLVRLSGATGGHVWSKELPGNGFTSGFLEEGELATDPVGNIIAAGSVNGTIDWGAGPVTSLGTNDVFLAKFDGAGALLWTKQVGSTRRETAEAVVTTAAGEIFVMGWMNGTLDFGAGPITSTNPTTLGYETTFVAKLAPNGAGLWAKVFSTNGARVTAYGSGLASDGAGNIILTGGAMCALDFGGGPLPATDGSSNIFIAKLDGATGKHLWSKGWASGPSPAGGGGRDVAVDFENNTLFTAELASSTIDVGGGPLTAGGAPGGSIVAKFGP